MVQERLNNGADFAKLAKEYSDDNVSAKIGGDLEYISRRMMAPAFEEKLFSTPWGEVSDIFATNFGFHILKVTEIPESPTIEMEREKLKRFYERYIYNIDKDALIEELKEKTNFISFDTVFQYLKNETS